MTDTSGPPVVRNPVSIAGAWLTTLAAFAFLGYLAAEAFGLLESPYSGLLGFVVVPAMFVAGLAPDPARDVARRAPPQAGQRGVEVACGRSAAAPQPDHRRRGPVSHARQRGGGRRGRAWRHALHGEPHVLRAGLSRADAAGVHSASGVVAQQRGLCGVSRRPRRARHHQGQAERHPADVPVRDQYTQPADSRARARTAGRCRYVRALSHARPARSRYHA